MVLLDPPPLADVPLAVPLIPKEVPPPIGFPPVRPLILCVTPLPGSPNPEEYYYDPLPDVLQGSSFAMVLPSHGTLVIQVKGGGHHVPTPVHHGSLSYCPDPVGANVSLSARPLLCYGGHGLVPKIQSHCMSVLPQHCVLTMIMGGSSMQLPLPPTISTTAIPTMAILCIMGGTHLLKCLPQCMGGILLLFRMYLHLCTEVEQPFPRSGGVSPCGCIGYPEPWLCGLVDSPFFAAEQSLFLFWLSYHDILFQPWSRPTSSCLAPFPEVSALKTYCCPDLVANAFSSLLSIFNELQGDNEPILAFWSWFDGLIFEMACCKVVIPPLLLVMLFLCTLHSCYSNFVEQFWACHKSIETTLTDMTVNNVTYHNEFILKKPHHANKSPKLPSQIPTAAAAHMDNTGTV
jgi:hypothetical protein